MPTDLLVDAYFQARTVKGYRYLDDAGKIMNQWDTYFPEKTVGIDGLNMANMDAVLRRLRVDMNNIWLNLNIPDNIDQVVNLAHDTTTRVAEIIGVDQFRRVGLRLEYVYAVKDTGSATVQAISNLFSGQWLTATDNAVWRRRAFQFMVPLNSRDPEVNLRVAVVRRHPKMQPRKELPESGIMADLDLFRTGIIDVRDLKAFLSKAKEWIEKEFPSVRDDLLKEVDLG